MTFATLRRAALGASLFSLLLPLAATAQSAGFSPQNPPVTPGVTVLLEDPAFFPLVEGKRAGLITNPTGVDARLRSTVDLLHDNPAVTLAALFGPEHGVRGDAYAGDKVDDTTDPKTGVPVYSLYGATRRPKPEWLENLDVMIYDIQDIGSSSYTYIYTMAYAMEACGEAGIPFLVLDRPNPVGADYIDGPVINTEEYSTFVGLYNIAYMYGMTPGETAMMFNADYNTTKCELTVVPMNGYHRSMRQWDTGLPFVPTSTHIPHAETSFFYSLTGIMGEIRNGLNIGVGYTLPFETIAAPWIDREQLTDALNAKNLPGIHFRPISYKPKYAAYKDEMCHGVQIFISDYKAVRPVTAQIHIIETLQKLYPGEGVFTDARAQGSLFDEVLGTDSIRQRILAGETADAIIASYQDRVKEFEKTRSKHLIYD
ncbi:MAG: DUF1343 domain-containing protein [Sumerlaeia bacterium]